MPLLSGRRGRGQFEAFGFADGDVVQNDGREIGEQGVEAVHGRLVRHAFACGLGSRAEGEGSAGSTGEARCARAAFGSSLSNRIGASLFLMCHSAWQACMHKKARARMRASA